MTAIEAFDYLSSLLTKHYPLVLAGEGTFLHIEKRVDMDETIMVALKTTPDSGRAKECYLLDKSGVTGMQFEFPSIIEVPPCPIDFPAYMTDEQRSEWNRVRAEKVVEFVKSLQA